MAHADGAFARVIQPKVVHAILDKKAVGLACGFVGEEFPLEILFAREDFQLPFGGDLELLVDFHDTAGVQIDELQEVVESQGEDVVFLGQEVAPEVNKYQTREKNKFYPSVW